MTPGMSRASNRKNFGFDDTAQNRKSKSDKEMGNFVKNLASEVAKNQYGKKAPHDDLNVGADVSSIRSRKDAWQTGLLSGSFRMNKKKKEEEEEYLKEGEVEKLCADDRWKLRKLKLTEGELLITEKDDRVIDKIPLHELLEDHDDSMHGMNGHLQQSPTLHSRKSSTMSTYWDASQAMQFLRAREGSSANPLPTPHLREGSTRDLASVDEKQHGAENGNKQNMTTASVDGSGTGNRRQRGSFTGMAAMFNYPEEKAETEGDRTLKLSTIEGGYNSGRTYYLQCVSKAIRDEWVTEIEVWARKARAKFESRSRLMRMRKVVRKVYNHTICKTIVAIMIVLSFINSVVEAQLNPLPGDPAYENMARIDLGFTILFTIELAANWFGHGRQFLRDGWNWFDLVVVVVSIASVLVASGGISSVKALRMIRAVRLLRIVKRLRPLRRLMNALTSSIMPVLNAMIIVGLVILIYAVLGVNFWKEHNEDLFGTFAKASFTMFQISTLEGWNDIARNMFYEDGDVHTGAALFFTSFVVIEVWMCLPVVIAVLLDKFTLATQKEQEKDEEKRIKWARGPTTENPLDPVLGTLTNFDNDQDLSRKISAVYQALDSDGSERLSYEEIVEGLKKIPLFDHVHLAKEDFDSFAMNGALLDDKGEISMQNFEIAMREQVREYMYRQMTLATAIYQGRDPTIGLVLSGLKYVMLGMQEVTKSCAGAQSSPFASRSPLGAVRDGSASGSSKMFAGPGSMGHFSRTGNASGADKFVQSLPGPDKFASSPRFQVGVSDLASAPASVSEEIGPRGSGAVTFEVAEKLMQKMDEMLLRIVAVESRLSDGSASDHERSINPAKSRPRKRKSKSRSRTNVDSAKSVPPVKLQSEMVSDSPCSEEGDRDAQDGSWKRPLLHGRHDIKTRIPELQLREKLVPESQRGDALLAEWPGEPAAMNKAEIQTSEAQGGNVEARFESTCSKRESNETATGSRLSGTSFGAHHRNLNQLESPRTMEISETSSPRNMFTLSDMFTKPKQYIARRQGLFPATQLSHRTRGEASPLPHGPGGGGGRVSTVAPTPESDSDPVSLFLCCLQLRMWVYGGIR